MKILLFIDNLGSGGAQRQLVNLALLLNNHSIDVEVLCYHHDDFYAHILIEKQIKINWVTPSSYLKRILEIRKFIRKAQYKAVISFLDTPDFINCISGIGGHSWKIITSERSAQENHLLSKKGKVFAFFKRFSDYIVCNSENAQKMWLKHYPNYKNKLKVIYNIVQIANPSNKYNIRTNGKLNVIVAASYQELKNPINVIQAIQLLGADKNKIVLNWYGAKNANQETQNVSNNCIKLLNDYDLNDIITINESTKNIADKMNQADVVGLFSRVEGLPNAIAEGMSLAKPIIMTKVSDYANFVDEKNGVLCDWDNVESIKNAFQCMINLSNNEILEMGQQSKLKADMLFGKENNLTNWLNVIKE